MKYVLFSMLLLTSSAWAQSKKELLKEVESLKAEIAELKRPKVPNLEDKHEKASYSLGALVGNNLKTQAGDSINLDAVIIGMTDVFQEKELKLDMQACGETVQSYFAELSNKKLAAIREASLKYLEENKAKEGVTVTTSGLQYRVLTQGSGGTPTADDEVTVHYTGKLVDGTVFDSSVERGEPVTFPVGQVIPGWTEALQLMKEGDKWEIVLPSNIAYGEQGAGQEIPPNATLIFEVELIKVN